MADLMSYPESPHQAAIAGSFKAKVRPALHPKAAELVAIYEAVPGALTYPGCCPEGLAEVLSLVATYEGIDLWHWVVLLRGEQS